MENQKNQMTYIISITGDLGAGKSILTKSIAEKLGMQKVSIGDLQRKFAKDHNMTTTQFNKYMESHPEFDHLYDNELKKFNESEAKWVFDSRMAWFFIPKSFKVHLKVNIKIAAERVHADQNRMSENYVDSKEAEQNITKRKSSEVYRFKTKYGVNINDPENYDLIIDTSAAPPQEIENIIITSFNAWNNRKHYNKFWVPPTFLYPTQNVRKISETYTEQILRSIEIEGFNTLLPVITILCDGNHYIYDGHKRTSVSILHDLNLIPVIVGFSEGDHVINELKASTYVRDHCGLSTIYDWEDAHNFRFIEYPDHIRKLRGEE